MYKLCIISLILLVAAVIIFRLAESRASLFYEKEASSEDAPLRPTATEEFSILSAAFGATPSSEAAAMAVKPAVGVKPLVSPTLPLKEFCVKAAFNAAYSGSYVSTDAIAYVLSRGCRFLDFEVFEVDGALRVGVCDAPLASTQNITSKNTISLNDALMKVVVAGFSAPAPNSSDPLFVRIRLRPFAATNDFTTAYRLASMDIENTLHARLFTGKVDSSTPVAQLQGKVVVVWDKSSAPEFSSVASLASMIHIVSGGDALRTYSYERLLDQHASPPNVGERGASDVSRLTLVEPSLTTSGAGNPQFAAFVRDYGVQVVMMRFYVADSALESYETFFRDCGAAMVPFREAVPYTA
jgi:hypothetical protein